MSLTIEVVSSLAEVEPEAWNALVDGEDPFMEHGFLRLLETSESVGPARTGWAPQHVLVRRGETLIAAMPLYLKGHSYGEFIFDFGWANAAHRAGISYYPKLVSAAPMTPATGRRLLTHPHESREELAAVLLAAAREVTTATDASSLHLLFCREDEAVFAQRAGLHARESYQYHWENPGSFRVFDDFMAALRNSSRKQVRKERERAKAYGLTLSMRKASELDAASREAMYRFYRQTIDDKGSSAYLTRGFFRGMGALEHAYAAMAHDGDEPVAGALFFYKGHSLFGRYWGASRDLPNLHFELCYYMPMEWGLARGMQRFEAGAQGEHKIKRGFLPNLCRSAHWAVHPGLDRAIAQFVRDESRYVRDEMQMLAQSTPFKRGDE